MLEKTKEFPSRCGHATLKHEALKEQLLREISALPPGTKLPTVRQLVERYQVSRVTVGRALDQLKDSGFIDATVGRGTYTSNRITADRPLSLQLVDLLLFCDDVEFASKPGFHTEMLDQLHKVLGKQNARLRTTILPYYATLTQTVAKIEQLNPQAILLDNVTSAETIEIARRRKIPCVALFPSLSCDKGNSLLIDNNRLVRQQLNHLFQLGHRKIAYLHPVCQRTFHRDHAERLHCFYEEHARAGIVPNPELIRYGGFTARESYEATRELIDLGHEFTAIVCGDERAKGIYDALNEAGLLIGKDVSVIGEDDCKWAAQMQPPLTTIRIDRDRFAKRAVKRLQDMLRSGETSFESERIEPDLIARDSTGPVVA